MMRYLQRQRKSVISSTGFKRVFCLLSAVMILLSAAVPMDNLRDMKREAVQQVQRVPDGPGGSQLGYCVASGGGEVLQAAVSMLSVPSARRSEEQYTGRELLGMWNIEALGQQVTFRYRYLQQSRLFTWYVILGFLLLPELLRQYFGGGRKKQRELVPRSRMIVTYMRKADGKKNGIASSIK